MWIPKRSQDLNTVRSHVFDRSIIYKDAQGFALVEALIAAAILSTVIAFMVASYLSATQISSINGNRLEAAYLADEGIEAVRSLRDRGWTSYIAPLTVGTTYYLAWNGSTWEATSTNIYVDSKFERKFTLSQVIRDANDQIGGSVSLDPNSKKVTVTVSWFQQGATTSKSLSAYISNLRNN